LGKHNNIARLGTLKKTPKTTQLFLMRDDNYPEDLKMDAKEHWPDLGKAVSSATLGSLYLPSFARAVIK